MKLRHRDISYLLLWVSLFILCSTVAEMQLPIAVLHIGPCKTSSTYIQEGINMFRDLLEKDNYHLIRPRGAKESLKLVDHDFAYALARRDNPTLLETYRSSLQQMREKGQNVIISSEVFGMPLNYPLHMKRRMDIVNFLEGFEVHLVVYHRDWLTHWISFFNYFFDSLTDERLISSSILAIPHVLTALLFLLKNKSVSDRTDAHVLSKYYLEAFHAQSTAIKLHIVDLNGLIAANADTGLVLLTEVLPRTSVAFKDAVLKEYFQRRNACKECNDTNPSSSLYVETVAKYYYNISLVQDSAFVFLNLTNATCLRTFITVVDSQVVEHPLPLACATEERMSELRSEALYRDKNLRNVFGEFILYSNRSANVKKILNVQATRICRLQADKLLLDKFWYSFLLGMQDRMADCKTMTKQQ